MNTSTLLFCLLVLHLVALVGMAGTTFMEFIGYRTFWNLYEHDRVKSYGIYQFLSKFSRILGLSAAVLVFSGIGMMALTKGVIGEQLWFRIKFGLVLLLIANRIFVGGRQGARLKKILDHDPEDIVKLNVIKNNLTGYHLAQLILFLIIIILSVFKFN